jgi:uncharacterized DUF497 family protein
MAFAELRVLPLATVRVISLRRAHKTEEKRYEEKA